MEYFTKYPKTIYLPNGIIEKIQADAKNGVEQLTIIVKKNINELLKIFVDEGFTKVKFEHKKPFQIGNGLSLKHQQAMGTACKVSRNEKRHNCNICRSGSVKRLFTTSFFSTNSSNL